MFGDHDYDTKSTRNGQLSINDVIEKKANSGKGEEDHQCLMLNFMYMGYTPKQIVH